MHKLCRALLCLSIIFFITHAAYASQTWVYHETKEGKVTKNVWKIVGETEDTLLLNVEEDNIQKDFTLNKKDLSTIKWSQIKKDLSVEAQRKEDSIILSAKKVDRRKEKVFKIDSRPWVQCFGFSLRSFGIDDKETKKVFWTIDPDGLKPYRMIALREKEEKLKIGAVEYNSVKVRVTLDDWRSIFWNGYYWFRKGDGTFLRFEGKEGKPDSPGSFIELIEER